MALNIKPKEAAQLDLVALGETMIRLSPQGHGRLEFSTFVGGSANELSNDSTCDIDGNVFAAVHTSSTDFPTVRPYQADYAGGFRDGAVLEISNRYALSWSAPTAVGALQA